MEENSQFNLSNHKICRLCATTHVSGYELFTPNSKNYDKVVKTICGYIERKCTDQDLHFKWLCNRCHLAGTTTIEFLRLVKSGQQKLGEMFEATQLKKAEQQKEVQENKCLQMPKDLENSTDAIIDVKRRSRAKGPPNTTAKIDSVYEHMCMTLQSNKRQRRLPKRLLDEISGKVLRPKNTIPIVITPTSKEIDSCTLINSESIAEFRSATGDTLGEVIEVADAINNSDFKDESSQLTTYFICEYCKAAFTKRYDFLQHIVTHENCIYECSACLQNFQSKSSFDEHQKKLGHDGCGIIEFAAGTKCTDENFDAAALNVGVDVANVQITSINGKKKDHKDDSFQSPEERTEIRNANSMYACLHCSKTFDNLYAIRRHYQLVHVAMRAYKCELCSASFKTNYNLNVHHATHTGEKRHCCIFCEKTFVTKHAWEIHTRIHTGEKPFKCKDCSKLFANRGNLMTHRRVHTGERPYKCTTCELCFKSLSNLKKHKTIHLKDTKPIGRQLDRSVSSLLRPIKPEIKSVVILPPCKNTNQVPLNNNITNLKESINTSDPTKSMELTINTATTNISSIIKLASKPTYRFRCSFCCKQFNHWSSFKKHQRTHTGERPYKCPMCPKAFADSSNYKKHKILHKNVTYALKIESEKQKMRQILENESSLDIKDAASLSPTSVVSDPDPDGLEEFQRMDTRRHDFTSSLPSDSDDVNIDTDRALNKERFITWDNFDYSLLQPKIISTHALAEGTKNKLKSRSNAINLLPSSSLAAESKQVICISYQDPTNPVGKKTTTFYAIN